METVIAQTYIEVICSCPKCNAVLDILKMSGISELL